MRRFTASWPPPQPILALHLFNQGRKLCCSSGRKPCLFSEVHSHRRPLLVKAKDYNSKFELKVESCV